MSIFLNGHGSHGSNGQGDNGGSGNGHSRKGSRNSLSKILGHTRSGSSEHNTINMSSSSPGPQQQLSASTNILADQYDRDRDALTRSCFSKTDAEGRFIETYITHVRITEDSHYPSSRPPPSSPASAKKFRVIAIAVRASGKVRIHKARENANGTFQIGKTWNLDEFSEIQNDPNDAFGFVIYLGKPYYWATNSVHEKAKFIHSIVKIYKKYTNGYIPKLKGVDSIVADLIQGARVASGPGQGPSPPSTSGGLPYRQGSQQTLQPPPSQGSRGSSDNSRVSPQIRPVEGIPSRSSPGPGVAPLNVPFESPRESSPREAPRESPREPIRTAKSLMPQNSHHDVRRGPQPVQNPAPVPASVPVSSQSPRNNMNMRPPPSVSNPSYLSHASNSSNGDSQRSNAPSIEARRGPNLQGPSRTSSETSSNSFRMASKPPINQGPQLSISTSQPRLPLPSQIDTEPAESPSSIVDTPVKYLSSDQQSNLDVNVPTLSTDYASDMEPSPALARSTTGLQIPDESSKHETSSISDVKVFARAASPSETSVARDLQNDAQAGGSSNTELKRNTHHRNKSSISSVGYNPGGGRRRLSFSAGSNASAVEETLIEFNWSGHDDSAALEKRIADELNQIEMSHLHNIVDVEDKLDELDKTLEAAISETADLEKMFAFFSMQLGTFMDDIAHIEGQGQGLQIQTTNQKALWTELDHLLRTVALADRQVDILHHNNFENIGELQQIENALADLYDALKAVRVKKGSESEQLGKMRALKERRAFVEQACFDFMLRFCKFCEKRFKDALKESEQLLPGPQPNAEPDVQSVDAFMLQKTFPITGVLLFAKEMDKTAYQTIVKEYESVVGPYYNTALSAFFSKSLMFVSAAIKKPEKLSFVNHRKSHHHHTPQAGGGLDNTISKSLKRSGTLAKLDFRDKASSSNVSLNGTLDDENNENEFAWYLPSSARDTITRMIRNIVTTTTRVMLSQQEVLISLFHMSSFGENSYLHYISNHPVKTRIRDVSMFQAYNVREIDSDRQQAQEVLEAMGVIFSSMQEQLLKTADIIANNAELMLPATIWLVETCLQKYQATNEDFLMQVYQRVLERLVSTWNNLLKKHVQEIGNTIITSKKRRGVVTFVRAFPVFCRFIEDSLVSLRETNVTSSIRNPGVLTSKAVEDGYDKISKAIFYNLQRIAKVPPNAGQNSKSNGTSISIAAATAASTGTGNEFEDKEILNYHVMMIENMNYLREQLDFGDSVKLQSIMTHTREMYRKELSSYIRIVLHRPAGRVMDFVEGVDSILARSANEDISRKPGYSRSAFKKTVATIEARELRKNVEVLRRRVEKHFSGLEDDTIPGGATASVSHANVNLINKVWSAIQAETIEYYNRLSIINDKYYSESGEPVQMAVTKADIVSAFQRRF